MQFISFICFHKFFFSEGTGEFMVMAEAKANTGIAASISGILQIVHLRCKTIIVLFHLLYISVILLSLKITS